MKYGCSIKKLCKKWKTNVRYLKRSGIYGWISNSVLVQQHETENVRRLKDGGMGGVDIHFFNYRMLTRAQELWKKLPV